MKRLKTTCFAFGIELHGNKIINPNHKIKVFKVKTLTQLACLKPKRGTHDQSFFFSSRRIQLTNIAKLKFRDKRKWKQRTINQNRATNLKHNRKKIIKASTALIHNTRV